MTKIRAGCRFLVVMIILLSLFPANMLALNTAGKESNQARISGADRYETAALIAQRGWDKSDSVILSAGMDANLVDALTAAPLARTKDMPILLTSGHSLNSFAGEQLKRLETKTVYITSGQGVIKQAVLDELSALKINIVPLGGADRYETAVNIAQEIKKTRELDTVVVTTSLSNADALTIAPIAAVNGWPVLLTAANTLSPDTGGFINQEQIAKTYVIGGVGAVSPTVEKALPDPTRIGGANRFETNLRIIENFKHQLDFSQGTYFANGLNEHLVDSLVGSSLIARTSSPLILTEKTLSPTVGSYLDGHPEIIKPIILGGEGAIDSSLPARFQQTPSLVSYGEPGSVLGSPDSADIQVFEGSVLLQGDSITIKNAVIERDLFIRGQGAVLENVTVRGKIYTNPENAANTRIDMVQSQRMVIQSYSDNGIHIDRNGQYGLTIYTKEEAEGIHLDFEGCLKAENAREQLAAIEFASGNGVGQIQVERVLGRQWQLTFSGIFNQPVVVDKMAYDHGSEAIPDYLKPDMPLDITSAPNAIKRLEIWAENGQLLTLRGYFEQVKVHSRLNLVLDGGVYDEISLLGDAGVSVHNQAVLKNVLAAGTNQLSLTQMSKIDHLKITGNAVLRTDAHTSVAHAEAAGTQSVMSGYGTVNGIRLNSPQFVPVPGAKEFTAVSYAIAVDPEGTPYPVAGEVNPLMLTLKDKAGKTAADVNGVLELTVANVIEAGDGTYGSVNGAAITGTDYTAGITIPVTFEQGKARVNLVLNHGKGPTGDARVEQEVWFTLKGLTSLGSHTLRFQVAGYRGYSHGKGTEADPYIIFTAEELNALRYHVDEKDMYIELGGDIDLGVYPYNTGEGWVPIEASIKKFDGKGHLIRNLYINRPNEDYQALLRRVGSGIQNVGLLDVKVTGRQHVAALTMGTQFIGSVLVTGNISGEHQVSGIADDVMQISRSMVRAAVSGGDETSGLVRNAWDVSNCYASGKISGTDKIGGLTLGAGYFSGNVSDFSAITGSGKDISRMALSIYPQGMIDKNLAYDGMLYKLTPGDNGSTVFPRMPDSIGSNNLDGENKTAAELSEQATYEELGPGWNFDTTWSMVDGRPELKMFLRNR
ncbi:cell wall-binding repeat-containing protein [Desulfitobacterium chlororespirans]|uniref:Putative cell wall binding repeat 2 n=1 Tax=Desulfitobacterium chlororespirans DSM 11544 TaxID=1121395 RepID=A0A1M7TR90_9FIRM|nr:cell wall-binding repeat-containing protein [Desulfitobacterium chlororespirans]SHN73242.1 Putative cell wall binding repeat 2 [Desulfitobacterium chlororespirans DSM 11544]